MPKKPSILIVDDRPENLLVMARVLDSLDADLTKAASGNEALRLCLKNDFAVALLDVQMAGIDGYELAELLRSDRRTKHMSIIFVSAAYSDDFHVFKGYESGAVDFVTKPFREEILLSKIRILLDLDQARRELNETNAILRKSEECYRLLAEHASDLISHQMPDGVIAYASPSCRELLGYDPGELVGLNAFTLIHPDDLERVRDGVRTIAQDECHRVEYRLARRGGDYVWVESATKMIKSEHDAAFELISVTRDIAERKRAEDEIQTALDREREINDLKNRFVATVSHEFRTPLTSIKASAYVIQKYGAKMGDADKSRHFDTIHKSLHHMTALLDDVLTLSRSDTGRQSLAPQPLHIGDFCRTLCDQIRMIAAPGQAIHCQIASSADACHDVDKRLLHHALTNLLANAVKYSPLDGAVDFDVRHDGGELVFVIRDHGIGIPEEDQKRLFEPFHRARNVSAIQGTGLGLSIAKRAVEAHGGVITFSSALGNGSTFIVAIPSTQKRDRGEAPMADEKMGI